MEAAFRHKTNKTDFQFLYNLFFYVSVVSKTEKKKKKKEYLKGNDTNRHYGSGTINGEEGISPDTEVTEPHTSSENPA